MNISQKGIDLIKEFEGCRLKAYRDAVNVLTIGYGTTNADKDIIGVVITDGMVITQKIADRWLELSINKKYLSKVSKYDNKYHFNQNQFDALVSFAYNIGSIDQLTQNGTRSIKEISEKILAYNKAGGKVLAGLTRRREAEKKLFDTPVKLGEPVKVEEKPKKKTYTGTFPTLPRRGYFQKGDKGTQVKYLQKFLNWYGNYGLVIDGDFGNKTLSAVKNYQSKESLVIDGLFGSKCLKRASSVKK